MAAHSISAAQEIVPNRIGKEVNRFASNWWARMASLNETGLVNVVCKVFEQGDEMLTLLSTEKQMVKCNPSVPSGLRGVCVCPSCVPRLLV